MGLIIGISAPYAKEKQLLYYTLTRCAEGKVSNGKEKFSQWANLEWYTYCTLGTKGKMA